MAAARLLREDGRLRTKVQPLTVIGDCLLQILHSPQLLKASEHDIGEVSYWKKLGDWDVREGGEQALDGDMWSLLHSFHFTQLLKASEHGLGEVIEIKWTLGIRVNNGINKGSKYSLLFRVKLFEMVCRRSSACESGS